MTSLLQFASHSSVALLLPHLFLAQDSEPGAAAASPVAMILPLIISLLVIVSMWKIYAKAGQPGWASLIPFYNLYIWCKIVGRPGWWLLLVLIPFVNFVIAIILCIDMAKSFGKGAGYGIGLALLGIIFMPILAFGSAHYQGPAAQKVIPPQIP